jgi:hypothetical protein
MGYRPCGRIRFYKLRDKYTIRVDARCEEHRLRLYQVPAVTPQTPRVARAS